VTFCLVDLEGAKENILPIKWYVHDFV